MRNRRLRFGAALVSLASIPLALGLAADAGTGRSALDASVVSVDGAELGMVRLVQLEGGTVRITGRLSGLTPGFHGFHIHAVGVCDSAAKDATGATVPFLSAGGHHVGGGTTHGDHDGDMPPVFAMSDGTGVIRYKTDRIAFADLLDGDGSAVVVHAGPDNLAHVPATTSSGAERYHSHVDNVAGPDAATKATGDAGARFGCGVIERD